MASAVTRRGRRKVARRTPKKKRRLFTRIASYDFKEARLLAALTREGAADLLFVSERTVRNWESGRQRVPYAAFKLLKVLGGYELPAAAWDGWRLNGDTLWSPERKPFRPHELGWWGLTCAMARSWIERYHTPARFEIELGHDDLGIAAPSPASQTAASESDAGGGVSTPARGVLGGPVALALSRQAAMDLEIEEMGGGAQRAPGRGPRPGRGRGARSAPRAP